MLMITETATMAASMRTTGSLSGESTPGDSSHAAKADVGKSNGKAKAVKKSARFRLSFIWRSLSCAHCHMFWPFFAIVTNIMVLYRLVRSNSFQDISTTGSRAALSGAGGMGGVGGMGAGRAQGGYKLNAG
jgi:hypothetical protein